MENNELYHYGILGMRWGVRRTPAQLGRSTTGKKTASSKSNNKNALSTSKQSNKKSVKDMTDDELRTRINRLQLEKNALDLERQMSSLSPQEVAKGRAFVQKIGKEVVTPALLNAGKTQLTNLLNDRLSKALGLDSKDDMAALKKTVDELNLKKQKSELEKYFKNDGKEQTSESDTLAKLAKDLENKGKIAKNAQYNDIEEILKKIIEEKNS